MTRKIFLAMCGFLVLGWPALATPPSALTITYDADKKNVHVSATHPSGRLERHYLRRVVLYINDKEKDSMYFPRQKLAWGMEEDIALEAKPGDKISVEVFCSQGGSAVAETVVPTPPGEDENVPQK